MCAFTARSAAKRRYSSSKFGLASPSPRSSRVPAGGAEERLSAVRGAIVDAVVATTKVSLVLHFRRVKFLMVFFRSATNDLFVQAASHAITLNLPVAFRLLFKGNSI